VLTLGSEQASIVVMPEAGAAIAGWTDAGTHVLRRAHPDAVLSGNVRGLGCFPMLPYCNRIEDGRFTWNGVSYQLDPGFGDQRHALHGVGFRQPWGVQQASPGEIVLTLEHDAIDGRARLWPFPFSATLRYRCSNDGLRVTLAVTNRHTEPAPFGIGLHPYFARPPGVTLQFEAGGVWMTGEEPLPRQHASVPAEWDHSHARTVGDAQLDNCFTNWTRRVQIVGLAAGITIEADDVFRHLQVYTPPNQDFFCVEPVSHVPNALNLPDLSPDQTMHIVQPGATLSGSITIGLGLRREARILAQMQEDDARRTRR
jgi:aldose 1-epimerase